MISTRCCCPTDRSFTSARGSMSMPNRRPSAVICASRSPKSSIPRRDGSTPNAMFSATVNGGTSMKCWCTIPMPSARASRGDWRRIASPSISTLPESGAVMPKSMFISVVLPAPFSPSKATISPRRTPNRTSLFARSDPYRLVSPRASRTYPS